MSLVTRPRPAQTSLPRSAGPGAHPRPPDGGGGAGRDRHRAERRWRAWSGSRRSPLGGASSDIWTLVIASVVSLFAGMALILAGELAAHPADNRLTHHLRLTRGGCPRCRWAGSRSARARSSRCCRTTSPRCTARPRTSTPPDARRAPSWRRRPTCSPWTGAWPSRCCRFRAFLFLRRAMKASGAHMQEFVERLGRINSATVEFVNGIPVVNSATAAARMAIARRSIWFSPAPSPPRAPVGHHGPCPRDDRAPVTVLGLVLAFGLLYAHLGWMVPLDVLPFALVAPGICAPMLLRTRCCMIWAARGAAQRAGAAANAHAGRPRARPTAAARRPGNPLRGRQLRLRPGASGAVEPQLHARARHGHGRRRPVGRGQIHAGAVACCASSTPPAAASRWAAPTCGSSTARRCTATSASCCRTCA